MTITKKEIQKGYDKIGSTVGLSKKFYRSILKMAGHISGRVIDLGCGRGLLLEHIRNRFPDASLFGGDISGVLVQKARQRNPQIQAFQGDAELLPFCEESFDYVFLTEVLEHLLDYQKGLEEIYRILRPNGRLLVSVPNKNWVSYETYMLERKKFQPVDDHWFTLHELDTLLVNVGFKIEKIGGADSLGRKTGLARHIEKVYMFLKPSLSLKRKRLVIRVRKI